MKKIHYTLVATLSIISAINMHSIQASAEYLYPSGEYVTFEQLKKGDVFTVAEDDEPLTYRVVKAKTNKHSLIEVEIAGVNENSYHPLSDTILSVDGEALEDIAPYKVVGIADYAFKDNKYIREFHTLPTYYFKYVGKGAFEGCTNLRKFGSFRQKLTTIKARAFYGCRSLNSFVLTGNKLKHIGKNAFTNSGSKIKLTADSMDDKQVSKVKRMFKKAGAKKIHIKRIS